MKRLLILCVMALGFGATACGNACDDAVEKLKECKVASEIQDAAEKEADECNEQSECESECANDASCSEINAALMGEANSFASCALKCAE